jgi:iron-siderophore transport system permease protein
MGPTVTTALLGRRTDAETGAAAVRVGRPRRVAALLAALAALGVAVLLSLMVGAQPLSPMSVIRELVQPGTGTTHDIVRGLRLERTVVAIVVGLALGGAGALMQALTRNPLADPGLLGVNAGAASVVVFALGSGARAATTPVRLALAGAVVTAVLSAYVNGIALSSQAAFDTMRFWLVGSVVGRDFSVLWDALPFLVVGAAIGLASTPALNAMAMGDDTGRALGIRVGRLRLATAVAITLLCGAATAIAGPITFLGLVLPHAARFLVGPDQRWVMPLSMLLSAALLVLADTAGRVVVSTGEVEAGIMTAFVGGPAFVSLVRRRRLAHL